MNRLIDLWANTVVKFRVLVIIMTLILLGLSFIPFKNLYFEGSTDMWFIEDDPVLTLYRDLKEMFQNDEYLLIGVKAPENEKNIFTAGALSLIKKMTDFFEEHEAVTKVKAITNFQYIQAKDDILEVTDLIPVEIENISDLSDLQLQQMSDIAAKEEIIHGILITQDLKHTMVSARLVEEKEVGYNPKIKLTQDFKNFIKKEGLDSKGIDFHISGSAAITESFFHYSSADQSVAYPLLIVIVVLLLFLIFRNMAGVLLPVFVIIASVIATIAFIGLNKWPLNMLNMVLPLLITVIALGDSLHIITGFYKERYTGIEPKSAVVNSVKKYFTPCLFTTITTASGFLALASSRLNPVLELGIASAFGVTAAFLFSVTILPAILSFTKGNAKKIERVVKTGKIAKLTDSLADFTFHNKKAITILTALLTLTSIILITQIEVDTNFVRNFKKDFPIRQALEYFDETYKGAVTLEFILDSGKEGGVKEPDFLNRVLDFQNYLESLEFTGKAMSVLNYIMKINKTMHNNMPGSFMLPETRQHVAQYLFLYTSEGPEEDLTDLKDYKERFMRITIRCRVAPSSVTKEWVDSIQKEINTTFNDLKIQITGRAVLFNNMDVYVQQGMISSFSLAMVIIIICFFLFTASFRYGLLSIIPSVLPIVAAGGIMGLFSIYLDLSTMIVAAVTIGIAVDDTIHFMIQYIKARKSGKGEREALRIAISNAGTAILYTSLILVCGFSMLMFSTFVPNIFLGLLGSIVIILALTGDLIVLPAIILLPEKRSPSS